MARPENKAKAKARLQERRSDPAELEKMRRQHAESSARWRAKNPANRKIVHMRSKFKTIYGLSPDDVERAVERVIAGGPCDACGETPATDVDHCHERKIFRGYLCHSCNAAAGYLYDNPVRAAALARYLSP